MSLDLALNIATYGLANVSAGLSTVSQNVANVSTPQYAVESTTQQSLSADGQGFGVRTGIVVRADDPALQAQVTRQTGEDSAWQTTSTALSALEPALGTVGASDDLGGRLTALQSAFSNLLADPGNGTQQGAVVAGAQAVAQSISTLSAGYGEARQAAQDGLVADVSTLNAGLTQLGSLSQQIISLRAQGKSSADLENQRAQVEANVAQLLDVRFINQTSGGVTVLTASGVQLPTDVPKPVSIQAATTGPTVFYPGGGLPGLLVEGVDVTAQVTGGSIGARLALRDTTLPAYQAGLDQFAYSLSTRFADQGLTLFTDGSGTLPAAIGPNVQDGYIGYSATIAVNPLIVSDRNLVRDGTQVIAGSPTGASAFTPNPTGEAGFNTLVTRVLNYTFGSQVQAGVAQPAIVTTRLGPSGTLSAGIGSQNLLGDYANALTTAQAADSARASSHVTDSQGVLTALQAKLSTATGVSMDAELGHMVALQNAYGANAKVITAVESLFTELLNMVTQ